MTIVTASNSVAFSTVPDLDSVDIEIALLFVQSQRVDRLDEQLRLQLKEVQARNDANAALTRILDLFSSISNEIGGTDSTKKIPEEKVREFREALTKIAEEAGIDIDSILKIDTKKIAEYEKKLEDRSASLAQLKIDNKNDQEEYDELLKSDRDGEKISEVKERLVAYESEIRKHNYEINTYKEVIATAKTGLTKDTTKGEIDVAINKIKGMMDTNNSSNQMDMLRLQQLTSKRNESFELMTNFVKKMADSRQSIISNMR